MNEFIEVTTVEDKKVLLPINKIFSIVETDIENCFIETGCDFDGESTGFYIKETYEQIVKQLNEKIGKQSIIQSLNDKFSNLLK